MVGGVRRREGGSESEGVEVKRDGFEGWVGEVGLRSRAGVVRLRGGEIGDGRSDVE